MKQDWEEFFYVSFHIATNKRQYLHYASPYRLLVLALIYCYKWAGNYAGVQRCSKKNVRALLGHLYWVLPYAKMVVFANGSCIHYRTCIVTVTYLNMVSNCWSSSLLLLLMTISSVQLLQFASSFHLGVAWSLSYIRTKKFMKTYNRM